jgi:hypothetical protein
VPLTGVALLLAGGATGAYLAITGGVVALGAEPPSAHEAPAAASPAPDAPQQGIGPAMGPVTVHRPAPARPSSSAPAGTARAEAAVDVGVPIEQPIAEPIGVAPSPLPSAPTPLPSAQPSSTPTDSPSAAPEVGG